jgi:hypothetical protein
MSNPRRIVSATILVEWNDNPKPVVLNNDMPNGLANDFDDWLTECEDEENANGRMQMSVRKTNKDRANDIYRLMLVFLQYYGFEESYADEENWFIRDLLCDLKHFCDDYAIDFYGELIRAEEFYDLEVQEEKEEELANVS